jgi:hypothetical protein
MYPYSVIRGGVYSAVEFDAAMRRDAVASAHYAGFHRETLRLTRASVSMSMYASYRIGSSVYWTSHPVHISAGEALITDGVSLGRARCGNRLSDSPRLPVTRMEPMERDMETPDATDFAIPLVGDSIGDSRSLDGLLAPKPPIAPVSALVFEVFPPAALPAVSAPGTMFANSTAPPGLIPSISWGPQPDTSAQTLTPSGRETSQPSEPDPTLPPQTFPSTAPPVAIFRIPDVPLPGFLGVIDETAGSHGGSGFSGAPPDQLPDQPPTTSQSPQSPPLTNALPPAEPEPETMDSASSFPGVKNVPEPGAGLLLCTGLAFLRFAARRFRPSTR